MLRFGILQKTVLDLFNRNEVKCNMQDQMQKGLYQLTPTSATSWVLPLDPRVERSLGTWADEGLTLPLCEAAQKRANAACK